MTPAPRLIHILCLGPLQPLRHPLIVAQRALWAWPDVLQANAGCVGDDDVTTLAAQLPWVVMPIAHRLHN